RIVCRDCRSTVQKDNASMRFHFSNIAKFYTWSCISGFNLVYIIQAIYLLNRGFTATQLALFASMTALFSTLLEIPTGYIADALSRKISVALGFLCVSVAYIGLVF